MSSFNLKTTIGNLPNVISTLNNVGTVNSQNFTAQTLTSGLNSFSVSLNAGTYIIGYTVIIYQTVTTQQQIRSLECCVNTATSLIRDYTYEAFDYVMPVNTFNTDYITCSKTYIAQIRTTGAYNLLVNLGIGTGATYYCNIFFQSVRII